MDLIATLRSFLRVAETGSFSAVAAERGVTQPAISRQVSALEEHLGTRLVQRSTQAVTLTEEGRHFLISARDMVEAADAMLQSAAHRRGQPVGVVRVSTPVSPGLFISRHLPCLLGRHPELAVEVVIRDRQGNLIEEGLDLEISPVAPEDPSVITRRAGYSATVLVAAPGYLAGRATPLRPPDLQAHEAIIQDAAGSSCVWRFRDAETDVKSSDFDHSVEVRGRFASNNASSAYHASLAGHGIAILPAYLVAEDIENGRLTRLLPQFEPQGSPIHVSYPSRRSLPPRTRTVIDFLVEILQGDARLALCSNDGQCPSRLSGTGANSLFV
jgi:DNA-binding transcriptional LysR family regulator